MKKRESRSQKEAVTVFSQALGQFVSQVTQLRNWSRYVKFVKNTKAGTVSVMIFGLPTKIYNRLIPRLRSFARSKKGVSYCPVRKEYKLA